MKTILFILLTSLTLSAKAQGIEAVLQQIEANNTTLAALRQQAEAEKKTGESCGKKRFFHFVPFLSHDCA